MSANDGWLLLWVGVASMLMGVAMLTMPRQRVVARSVPTLRRLPAEMMGQLYEKMSDESSQGKESVKLGAFIKVRKALRKKYPEPYFWAPFIYIGDPR